MAAKYNADDIAAMIKRGADKRKNFDQGRKDEIKKLRADKRAFNSKTLLGDYRGADVRFSPRYPVYK
jgi:hypothetical protein